jgi:hypothetical protein
LAFKQSIRELITTNFELDTHNDEALAKLMSDEVSVRLGKKPIAQFLAEDRKFMAKVNLVLALVARSDLE